MNLVIEIIKVSFSMFWVVLWPLILGLTISAFIQTFISRAKLSSILGANSLKSASIATMFGAASSSCSYAAVAIAKSLFKKGASFTNAMIFEIASTNLVIELGVILLVLLGWQFALSEIIGGLIMIAILSLIFRLTLSQSIVFSARQQVDRNITGAMEGHASMDMSIGINNIFNKLFKGEAFTAVSHYFISDLISIWKDILIGFLLAGILTVIVPSSIWQMFFFKNNHTVSFILGPIFGPIIAVLTFVCSVGNIPLAAVLWKGGISFGGVISFIFADLIVLPILNIYRKYYGLRATIYIFISFFVAMIFAGYFIEILFTFFNLVPSDRSVKFISDQISFNYTTILNIVFLIIASLLAWRFFVTGGISMIKMMDSDESHVHHHKM